MSSDIAISVKGVSKTFKIPHEKVSSIRGAVTGIFRDKSYEEFKALDDVSFEVKKGEFFGIIGRNGSGKSTLLKVLAGIYQADKGSVKVNGMISPFLELGIGFNPELSGRDNVYLNATVLGMTQKQIDEKFDAIVAFSELERFIDQKLKNYSSGMQVRLAFSVSIHANRDILLMDEVLAVGDSNFQSKCLTEFRKLKKNGKTIIFVSHDIESVREYCDRAMLLNNGEIIISSSADRAIYEYSQILIENKNGEIENIKKSEKNTTIEKKSRKVNKYLEIKTYDSAGNGTKVFEGGDDIVVSISLDIREIKDDMYISVGIFDEATDAIICGNNMYFENVHKKWKQGVNEVKLIFKDSLLHKGDFYISSSFFEGNPKDNNQYDYYHGKENGQYIKIIPKTRHQGFVHIPHEWE